MEGDEFFIAWGTEDDALHDEGLFIAWGNMMEDVLEPPLPVVGDFDDDMPPLVADDGEDDGMVFFIGTEMNENNEGMETGAD